LVNSTKVSIAKAENLRASTTRLGIGRRSAAVGSGRIPAYWRVFRPTRRVSAAAFYKPTLARRRKRIAARAATSLNGVRILRPDTVALMGQNQIGPIDVGVLRTTAPTVSNDVDFFPGIKLKWGFGHMITTQPVSEGRSAGSLTWAGIYNTYYWIDPKKRIAAVFMTQVLPFADQRVLRVYRQFERGVYAAVKAGYVKAD
jgi:CubicO group peptidase (beta-lactamase class C family)